MLTNSKEPLWVVKIRADDGLVSEIERLLEIGEYEWAQVSAEEDPQVGFEIYFSRRAEARAALSALDNSIQTDAGSPRMELHRLEAQDWSESWKHNFHASEVSDRIVVQPPWEEARVNEGQFIVEINPGMSFGTGLHFTTRSCITLLDRLQKTGLRSFCDLGCGSGILSIAAARLGYTRILAVDSQEESIDSTQQNMERNNLAGRIQCIQSDVADFRTSERFDLVAANILADVLLANSTTIARLPNETKQARLILSGIDKDHRENVRAAYEAQGLNYVSSLEEPPWITAVWRR